MGEHTGYWGSQRRPSSSLDIQEGFLEEVTIPLRPEGG